MNITTSAFANPSSTASRSVRYIADPLVLALTALVLSVTMVWAPPASAAEDATSPHARRASYEIPRVVSGATVHVSSTVHAKVTDYHKVPDWLVIKSVMYAVPASFAVQNPDYSPYTFRVWEWLCDSDGCERTDRSQLMRIVINWVNGKEDDGDLVTAYCKRSGSKECPEWVRTAGPYWGPPGPQ